MSIIASANWLLWLDCGPVKRELLKIKSTNAIVMTVNNIFANLFLVIDDILFNQYFKSPISYIVRKIRFITVDDIGKAVRPSFVAHNHPAPGGSAATITILFCYQPALPDGYNSSKMVP